LHIATATIGLELSLPFIERRVLAALEALLGHPIGNLRKEAALALGELADPASAQALRVAEGDGDPEVRKAVRIALAQLRVPA
ncbi:HEAT repeat domain-containing protein, partial [Pseudomonas aeruginosa]|nr:HEAT repeat domain-containing protein [Pseudomonas aeruginosa]